MQIVVWFGVMFAAMEFASVKFLNWMLMVGVTLKSADASCVVSAPVINNPPPNHLLTGVWTTPCWVVPDVEKYNPATPTKATRIKVAAMIYVCESLILFTSRAALGMLRIPVHCQFSVLLMLVAYCKQAVGHIAVLIDNWPVLAAPVGIVVLQASCK